MNIIAVNGCCYGRTIKYDRGDYLKLSGQSFWSFITGEDGFYLKIIEPIGYKAKEKNQEFMEQYSMIVNSFTKEFIKEFCFENGIINWEKLTRFNSSKQN